MRETLKVLEWLSKAIIANNWFSGSVQVCIIVVEHDNWIKRNVNVLNRRLNYMYRKTPEHTLKS